VTIRGVWFGRVMAAASFGSLALYFGVLAFTGLMQSPQEEAMWILLDLTSGTLAVGLAIRSLASRLELLTSGLMAHGLWRSSLYSWQDIDDFYETTFLGGRVVSMRLTDGRRRRLPLLVQPTEDVGREELMRTLRQKRDDTSAEPGVDACGSSTSLRVHVGGTTKGWAITTVSSVRRTRPSMRKDRTTVVRVASQIWCKRPTDAGSLR
jgi:hypothetical protein